MGVTRSLLAVVIVGSLSLTMTVGKCLLLINVIEKNEFVFYSR